VLERDGLVGAGSVRRDGPGRPSASYGLTDKALRLFPDRSGEFANELLSYLEEEHGRGALLGFLRWRQAQQGSRYAAGLAPYDAASVGSWVHGAAATLAAADGPFVAGDVALSVPHALRALL
jgi:predicted ArsR family transcriptional regulator